MTTEYVEVIFANSPDNVYPEHHSEYYSDPSSPWGLLCNSLQIYPRIAYNQTDDSLSVTLTVISQDDAELLEDAPYVYTSYEDLTVDYPQTAGTFDWTHTNEDGSAEIVSKSKLDSVRWQL